MAPPTVSVVIPCYRHGRFLGGAIESALAQSHGAVEVIVVDDGSDDDTAEVAARYGDRVRYFAQPNRGLSAARNAGLRLATGRFVHFLDADDLLHAEALARLVAAMAERDDRLAFIGFKPFTVDPQSDPGPEYVPAGGVDWYRAMFAYEPDPLLRQVPVARAEDPWSPLPHLFYSNFGPPHCWLCPRHLVDRVGGFDETLRSCEDWDLWLRIALVGASLRSVELLGAYYRQSAGSMSTQTDRMLDTRTVVLLKAMRSARNDAALRRRWAGDLVLAARHVRRRFLARESRSPRLEELNRETRRLCWSGGASLALGERVRELVAGAGSDRRAVALFRRQRPDLVEYYRTGYD